MPDIVSKSNDLINYEIETDGFSVLYPSDHKFSQLASLKKRFSKEICQQLFNKVKIFNLDDLLKIENKDLASYDLFCNQIIRNLYQKKLFLSNIFQTFDNKESKHIAQKPHIDRIPTLKFMLYVNDLDFNNGAFCLSPGSNHWTKKKFGKVRKSYTDEKFFEETRDIPKPILKRMIPIEGKAGTIIIFNTDCVHHQGIVKSGETCIFRAHYRETNIQENLILSKKFLLKKFLRKYF